MIETILFVFMIGSCTVGMLKKDKTLNDFNESYSINNSKSEIFEFENDTLKQYVELYSRNEREISFLLVSRNKITMQEARLAGIAKNKGGDAELDEDADGYAYVVTEYIYDNECWLAFRLDNDTNTRIRVNEADCAMSTDSTPFYSIALLVKKGFGVGL